MHGVVLIWTNYLVNWSKTNQILTDHDTNGTIKIKKVLTIVLNGSNWSI